MRTYTKLSALAAAFLAASIPTLANDRETLTINIGGINIKTSTDAELVFDEEDVLIDDTADLSDNMPIIKEALLLDDDDITLDDTIEYKFISLPIKIETNTPIVEEKIEKNDIGAYSIELPNNGLIYAAQDPNIGDVILNIKTLPYVSFSDGIINEHIMFYIRSNYSAFIERFEISLYRGSDSDLIEPLVIIELEPTSFDIFAWDGTLPDKYSYNVGDKLIYVLKAYDKNGSFDETNRGTIELLKPEDVKNGKDSLQKFASKEQGVQLSADEAVNRYLLDEAFSSNALYRQNIVVQGSKIVIRGSNIPESTSVSINNSSYPIDFERKFTAEYIVPEGTHYYDIDLRGKYPLSDRFKVEVSPYYFFGVGIADFTLRKADVSGYSSSNDEDLFQDGRLGFYLKGKAYGKYHITAQADTTQKDIKKMFNGFTQAEPADLFKSLDPDMYYPTYGDDSTTFRDVNTQGRFYIKADWDKSQALWGNYNTEFDGTRYGGYSRSLYGAKIDFRSVKINEFGDAKSNVKLFGSQAKSAAGHAEFLGTGGSLYYLKHTDIIPGSDKILLQVADSKTGNIIARINLLRGADYEIDNIQGRIILSRPLSQVIYQNINSITASTSLSGYEQRLIADYEFVPRGFDDEYITAGIRAKQWFGDNVAVGGTYVKENRGVNDYEMMSGDVTLQAGKGTYLKTEFSQTKSDAAPIYYSDNGGFSFTSLGTHSNGTSGEAMAIEGRVNFKELDWTSKEFSAGAWWRDVSSGFSSVATNNGITEYGAEATGEINKNLNLYAKFSKAQREDNTYTQTQITSKYKLSNRLSLSSEILHSNSKASGSLDAKGTVAAAKIDYELISNLEMFLSGQLTIHNDNGKYENNDAVTTGMRYLYNDSSVGARYIAGHRGEAAQIDISHNLNKDHTIYGGYTWSDNYASDFDNVFGISKNSGLTVGQRWNLTNRATLFSESQYIRKNSDKGSTNSLGMDFYLGEGWNFGVMYQKGELSANDKSGNIKRDSFSISAGKTSNVMNWLSKLEYRQDRGAEEREQWVTTNRLSYKFSDSLRLAGRINHSKTKDNLNSQNGAKFTETNLGFAYRPFDSNKWALFSRYTYLYDLATLGQDIVNGSAYDQKSQVLSLEGVYKLDETWEFALKYAARIGQARYGRGAGDWFDSSTVFYAGQIRYDIMREWHGLFEYRALDVKDGGVKQGYMVGLDKDLNDNLRMGIGYNFTDFSDDLTKLDHKYRGWFINVVGTY